jgi:hypothetical protein
MKLRYSTKYTIHRLFLPARGDSLNRVAFGRRMGTVYSARAGG